MYSTQPHAQQAHAGHLLKLSKNFSELNRLFIQTIILLIEKSGRTLAH
jgi:hypothetical protein